MPDIIDFSEAIEATKGKLRTLLLGNGFSAGLGHFHYKSLLDQSGLPDDTAARKLFAKLGTADFEAVIRALEIAANVEETYDGLDHAAEMRTDAQLVRNALVKAVHATHPKNRNELLPHYPVAIKFLWNFQSLFTLNYDLLLYWVVLETRHSFQDGFGLGDTSSDGSCRGPFRDDALCNMYNLHGGLHLFEDAIGETWKAINTGESVIAVIADAIAKKGQLPLYVAEGTTEQKQRRINSSVYLRHCYDRLRKNAAPVFVFGHSADDNDTHIYRAIFSSKVDHVYFGAYNADHDELCRLEGMISRHQKTAGSTAEITFFRSETVNIWHPAPASTPITV